MSTKDAVRGARGRAAAVAAAMLAAMLVPAGAVAQHPDDLPSEMPAHFTPVTSGFDYLRHDVMIPMRDGVKLHAVILVPKGAKRAPILLTRTPYNATALTSHAASTHLGPILQGYDNATDVIVDGGYIRVVQDIRGKWGSEGDYVMNRPLVGPLNPTKVDESTDTWDTIEWLIHNVPETNGRVGILGISYDGFLPLMALVNPHPALKVAVPMNPMVDGWRGDDWFHNGAFREQMMPYIYEQEASRTNDYAWWTDHYDDYDVYMDAGSAGELARRHGLEQVGFWRKVVAHPAYDTFWSEQAMDRILAKQPLKVPVMLVHSLWDQEDIYGAPAVYDAIEPKDTRNDMVYLVLGPWHHGGEIDDGSTLGALHFGSDTGLYFRQHVLAPFLARYLKDDDAATATARAGSHAGAYATAIAGAYAGSAIDADAPADPVSPVTVFVSGTNRWEHLDTWPAGCTAGCSVKPTPLYFGPGLKLGFDAPGRSAAPYDEYVSDPSKPVPYQPRPNRPASGDIWRNWLVTDQRPASGRPDVLTYVSDVLTEPVKIAGRPVANLVASTSGTDSDWIVKLIDVYPDEVAAQPEMGGYQLMISGDIFRGRYRESLSDPKPIEPGKPLLYRFALPTASHVFLPGHRIMVQVQSSWFPLYDRNPQSFVENIFNAKPSDYVKATQRVYHAPGEASFVELPMVVTGGE